MSAAAMEAEKDFGKKNKLLADLLSHKIITEQEYETKSKAYAAISVEKQEIQNTKPEGTSRSPSISAPETVKVYRVNLLYF